MEDRRKRDASFRGRRDRFRRILKLVGGFILFGIMALVVGGCSGGVIIPPRENVLETSYNKSKDTKHYHCHSIVEIRDIEVKTTICHTHDHAHKAYYYWKE